MRNSKESAAATLLKANHTSTIFLMVVQIALVSVLLIGGAVALGVLLDKVLATKSVFTFICAVVSAPASLFVAYWLGTRTVNKTKLADDAAAEIKAMLAGTRQADAPSSAATRLEPTIDNPATASPDPLED